MARLPKCGRSGPEKTGTSSPALLEMIKLVKIYRLPDKHPFATHSVAARTIIRRQLSEDRSDHAGAGRNTSIS